MGLGSENSNFEREFPYLFYGFGLQKLEFQNSNFEHEFSYLFYGFGLKKLEF